MSVARGQCRINSKIPLNENLRCISQWPEATLGEIGDFEEVQTFQKYPNQIKTFSKKSLF